ncbi:MAG: DUF1624 domain-containing protein [Burkholderiales bacterium]|jgi:uncharacterized membrane protein|nr:DUF1624 domain-containing protein [Burkholderiales bacterium]
MTPPSPHPRYLWLDVCRGLAICAMIAYHFAFDLNWFGVIQANFYYDPVLKAIRAAIVSSFLFIVGISLVIARQMNQSKKAFWRRILKITVCALIVSIASYLAFPQSFIYFGILHAIAFMTILAQSVLRFPKIALIVGILIITVGVIFTHPVFDPKPLSWIGFVTTLPRTEDFVPLFPWFGIVLLGIAFQMSGFGFHKADSTVSAIRDYTLIRILAWSGKHSLWIYMLHQPLLIAALWGILRIIKLS